MTNFEKMKEELRIEDIGKGGVCNVIHTMRQEQGCSFRNCKECIEWLKQEYKEAILDDAEKEYLSAVIKPFKNRVKCIKKVRDTSEEYIEIELDNIEIELDNDEYMFFSYFKKGTMYKGMKRNKEYSLKELGLE